MTSKEDSFTSLNELTVGFQLILWRYRATNYTHLDKFSHMAGIQKISNSNLRVLLRVLLPVKKGTWMSRVKEQFRE